MLKFLFLFFILLSKHFSHSYGTSLYSKLFLFFHKYASVLVSPVKELNSFLIIQTSFFFSHYFCLTKIKVVNAFLYILKGLCFHSMHHFLFWSHMYGIKCISIHSKRIFLHKEDPALFHTIMVQKALLFSKRFFSYTSMLDMKYDFTFLVS